MKIPLYLRLKKKLHREVAKAQDVILEVFYSIFPKGVLHGGTAIWRCYSGNRISEGLDVYIERDLQRIERFFEALEKRGIDVVKRRIGRNTLHSTLKVGEAEVRFEAVFKHVVGVIKEYETCEGNWFNVYTLPPEVLLEEKIEAYLERRKIRDLYDIFFLLRYVHEKEKVKPKLLRLVADFKSPVDEKELRSVLLYGAIPSAQEMVEYIRRWCE
jgi:predicted nucleotidyltransferase component of viral defense system